MEVSWTTVPGSGITYTVWYSTSSGTKTEPPSGASIVEGITGTSTNLSGLEKGIRYYIWVAAVSPNGQGPYSERVSETTYTGSYLLTILDSAHKIALRTSLAYVRSPEPFHPYHVWMKGRVHLPYIRI